MYAYISDLDKLLSRLEIEFPHKSYSRIIEEEKYRRIFALRDQKIMYPSNYNYNW